MFRPEALLGPTWARLALGGAIALASATARAQSTPPPPALPAAPDATQGAPIVVEVDSDTPSLDAARVREAIATELRAPVLATKPAEGGAIRGTLRVTWRDASNTLVVRYEPEGGAPVERVVRSDPRAESVITVAALLAGNLARNEASELLGELRPKKEEPPPEEPTAPKEPPPAKPQEPEPPLDGFHPVTMSFFYPVATNYGRPNVRTWFDLSLLYGRVGQVDGLTVATAVGYVRDGVNGVNAAGLVSYLHRKDMNGVHGAGLAAIVGKGDVEGVQGAGLFTLAGGNMDGAQGAGAVAIAGKDMTGVQGAGLLAIAGGEVAGLQASGLLSASKSLHGVQIAGLLNVTETVHGVQASNINVAGDIDGLQLGVVNIGRKARGVQLGVLNIAEEADAAIGAVSITKDGVHPVVYSTSTDVSLGFRFASKYLFTSLAVALRPDHIAEIPGASFAIGSRIDFTERIYGEAQLMYTEYPMDVENQDRETRQYRAHVIGGYKLAPRFAVFAGVGAMVQDREGPGGRNDVHSVRPDGVAGVQF